MIRVRPTALADTRQMAELLNATIATGGTTAITDPVSPQSLADWMDTNSAASAWHLAEDAAGTVVGLQWIGPHEELPPEACDIATFVKTGETGLGIGSRLFEATARAADLLGYGWINAEVRADNDSGLTYYQSRGFRIWGRREGVDLDEGTRVARVLTRYDLRD